jgi:hypothetical protein
MKITNEKMFIVGSTTARHAVKRRLIQENLIEYRCIDCGNTGEWAGKTLSLQLEHKNGISNDNRLENLTFICPNCHSQTDTYAGKNSRGMRTGDKENTNWTFRKEKKKRDLEKWNEVKNNVDVRFGEWGWRVRVAKLLNITPQKVNKWIARVDPEFSAVVTQW